MKTDEPAADLSDMLSFNHFSAAKLIPLLALLMEEGYGEIVADDLYQCCHAVSLTNKSVVGEFACVKDYRVNEVLTELGASSSDGLEVINVGTGTNTVEGLRRRVL